MRKAIIHGPGVCVSSGAYSPGLVVGNMCFVSGQSPVDPETGGLVDGDVAAQTHQTLTNLFAVLTAAGFKPGDLAYVNAVLSDLSDWDAVNAVYVERMADVENLPARMIVGGEVLPVGARLEIHAVAVRP
jgi:2-iminobutanoate/2-iminopropanoate deaminase